MLLEFLDASFAPAGKTPLFQHITFAVQGGECLAVTGPEGSGKSTALKVIMGLAELTDGYASLNGEPLTPLSGTWFRRKMAFMPQHPELMPYDTVAQLLSDPFLLRHSKGVKFDVELLHEQLQKLDIDPGMMALKPKEADPVGLRVAIMLAFAQLRRPVILLDNPMCEPAEAVNTTLDFLKGQGAIVVATAEDDRLRADKRINLTL